MIQLLLAIHLLTALLLVVLVLLQQGKGAEVGASFGAGASGTIFGSAGSWNFFSRLTAVLATVFFLTSLGLALAAKNAARVVPDVAVPLETLTAPAEAPAEGALPEGGVDAAAENGVESAPAPAELPEQP
ncbi:MAG: protein-export membrane protein SecG [Porticoccaceae bacterium]|nr:MAG: protein-export membrane protein SecG [Porticoccaceae bacterium]